MLKYIFLKFLTLQSVLNWATDVETRKMEIWKDSNARMRPRK